MNPQLFSAEENKRAEEVKKYLPVNIQLNFKSIAPYIVQCERKYIKPLLGDQLYDKLVSFYSNKNQDKSFTQLLEYVQFSLIHLAFWLGYDLLTVSLSDIGAASRIDSDKRLYRYQEDNAKDALKNQGFDELDTILEFLEKNINIFKEFTQSKFFGELKNSLIPDTATFSDIYNINNSRLIFLKMKYYVRDVENIKLRHWLGDRFVIDLLAADHSLKKYERIIPYIQRYIVYQSVCDGISELHKLPTERGLIFETEIANAYNSNVTVSVIAEKEMEKTRRYFSLTAEQYMSNVINTLKTYKEDYPIFFEFSGENPPEDDIVRRNNDNKKTFWM